MKNTIKWLGIIALSAIIVFSMAACKHDADDGPLVESYRWTDGGGIKYVLTITESRALTSGTYVLIRTAIDGSETKNSGTATSSGKLWTLTSSSGKTLVLEIEIDTANNKGTVTVKENNLTDFDVGSGEGLLSTPSGGGDTYDIISFLMEPQDFSDVFGNNPVDDGKMHFIDGSNEDLLYAIMDILVNDLMLSDPDVKVQGVSYTDVQSILEGNVSKGYMSPEEKNSILSKLNSAGAVVAYKVMDSNTVGVTAIIKFDSGPGGGGGPGGSGNPGELTITGISSMYNGKYAGVEGMIGSTFIVAFDSFTLMEGQKYKKIANGTVTLKVYVFSGMSPSAYNGSGIGDIYVEIYEDEYGMNDIFGYGINNVPFNNGNANVVWPW